MLAEDGSDTCGMWTPSRKRADKETRTRYPVVVNTQPEGGIPNQVGLCANCNFMRRMESDRGSTFYLCQRSATDPNFPKYPRLPVLRCSGYAPAEAHQENDLKASEHDGSERAE